MRLASRYISSCIILIATFVSLQVTESAATVVKFDSVMGPILVRLYESATPQTTANFLNYATVGAYTDTFIHRSVPGFIVQGGGFTFPSNQTGVVNVPANPPVINEPGISNLRGTIAMAKLGHDPNSATNQWFFNLNDNSANLDNQNGGFTVFGRVVGSGMEVVDQIAALPRVNASGGDPNGVFANLPVRDFQGGTIYKENLVTFNSIEVLNIPPGDYNFDGVVDHQDIAVWQSHFGSTTNAAADGNGDGIVNGADFLILQRNLGASTTVAASASAVPEPAAFWSLLLGAVLLLSCRLRLGSYSSSLR